MQFHIKLALIPPLVVGSPRSRTFDNWHSVIQDKQRLHYPLQRSLLRCLDLLKRCQSNELMIVLIVWWIGLARGADAGIIEVVRWVCIYIICGVIWNSWSDAVCVHPTRHGTVSATATANGRTSCCASIDICVAGTSHSKTASRSDGTSKCVSEARDASYLGISPELPLEGLAACWTLHLVSSRWDRTRSASLELSVHSAGAWTWQIHNLSIALSPPWSCDRQ